MLTTLLVEEDLVVRGGLSTHGVEFARRPPGAKGGASGASVGSAP